MTTPSHDHVNTALVKRLKDLYDATQRGDKNAEAALRAIAERSEQGDEEADVALNTLAVLYFQRTSPKEWEEAGRAFKRVASRDPKALAWAKSVQDSAKKGDAGSQRLFRMLQAHKNMASHSAWAVPDPSDDTKNTRVRNIPAMLTGPKPYPYFSAAPAKDSILTGRARPSLAVEADRLAAGETQSQIGASFDPTLAVAQAATAVSRQLQRLTSADEQRLVKLMFNAASAGLQLPGSMQSQSLAPSGPMAKGLGTVANSSSAKGLASLIAAANASPGTDLRAAPAAPAKTVVTSLGKKPGTGPGLSDEQLNAIRQDQRGMCDRAVDAQRRNSPAYPNVRNACFNLRRANIQAGLYIPDTMTTDDAAYRVWLTEAGEKVVQQNPKMMAFRATLPEGRQRGFTMAMGCRAGNMDPGFPAFVKPGLGGANAELWKGFDAGLKM